MSIVLFGGFEDDQVPTGSTGSPTASTSHPNTGTYGLRCNPVTTGVQAGQLTFSAIADSYLSVYVYLVAIPSSLDEELIVSRTSANAQKLAIRINSAGKLAAYNQANTLLATGTTVLSLNTQYRIEVHAGTGTSAAWEVKINGTSEISGTGDLTATNGGQYMLGKVVNHNGIGYDAFFDDYCVDNAGYPGAQGTLVLVPNATGTYQTATIGAGSTHPGAVSEIPHDSSTSYLVSDGVAGDAETENVTDTGTAGVSGTINAVSVVTYWARDGASNGSLKRRIRSGTTDSDSAAVATSSVYAGGTTFFLTDPATGAAWTLSGLDAVQAGFVENSANKSRVTAVYVMVNFTAGGSTPVSGSDTGTGADAGSGAAAVSDSDSGTGADAGAVGTVPLSGSDTGSGTDTGAGAAAVAASDTGAGADAGSVNTGATVAKPTLGAALNTADELYANLCICLPILGVEGASSNQLREYISGSLSTADALLATNLAGIDAGAPWSGPCIDNTATAATSRAGCHFTFAQLGLDGAGNVFSGTYTGPLTIAMLFKPVTSSVINQGLTAHLMDDNGTGPAYAYENSPTAGGIRVVGGSDPEFTWDASDPYIALIARWNSGTNAGLEVFTNINTSGLPASSLRRVSSHATADYATNIGFLGSATALNLIGPWGASAGSGFRGKPVSVFWWKDALSRTLDGSNNVTAGLLYDFNINPWRMFSAPAGGFYPWFANNHLGFAGAMGL